MMIVWSLDRAIPIRTYFEIDPLGIKSMDISQDGELILTLSFLREGCQRLSIYKWEDYSTQEPINTVEHKINSPFDIFNFIKWNYNDYNEFVTTGKKVVYFWKRDKKSKSISGYSPFIVKKDDKKKEN